MAVRAIGLSIAAGGVPLPLFRFTGLRGVLGFGGALLAAQFFWIIQSQADIVIAGRTMNPHDLGLYTEALFPTLILTAKFIPRSTEWRSPPMCSSAARAAARRGRF